MRVVTLIEIESCSTSPIGVKLRRREERLKGGRAGGDRKFLL
jgi:hypothetical protein